MDPRAAEDWSSRGLIVSSSSGVRASVSVLAGSMDLKSVRSFVVAGKEDSRVPVAAEELEEPADCGSVERSTAAVAAAARSRWTFMTSFFKLATEV